MKETKNIYKEHPISCPDGYIIQARSYGEISHDIPTLLIAGATGVPQRYYKKFSEHMNTLGYSVITFDYRGLADSKYGSLKGFDASFLDWAFKDYQSVLEWALLQCKPLIIGHSYGGLAFGLVEKSNETLGLCTFGTGAGWHGWMPRSEQIKILILWRLVAPVLSSIYGYLPSSMVGIGENLPMKVYKQWKKWCSYPHFWFDDPERDFQKNFSAIKVPVSVINSTDDLWAPPKSGKVFADHYEEAALTYYPVSPNDKAIGHMGYFHTDSLAESAIMVQKCFNNHREILISKIQDKS